MLASIDFLFHLNTVLISSPASLAFGIIFFAIQESQLFRSNSIFFKLFLAAKGNLLWNNFTVWHRRRLLSLLVVCHLSMVWREFKNIKHKKVLKLPRGIFDILFMKLCISWLLPSHAQIFHLLSLSLSEWRL